MRGDRAGAPKRADRQIDREFLTELLNEGLPGPEVVNRYRESGRGVIALNSVYAMRHHLGLPPLREQHLELLPWKMKPNHNSGFPAQMLRLESRHRRGETLSKDDEGKRARFVRRLEREGIVVDYNPANPEYHEGWAYVERRPGIDVDLIRDPFRDDKGNFIERPRGLRSGAKPTNPPS